MMKKGLAVHSNFYHPIIGSVKLALDGFSVKCRGMFFSVFFSVLTFMG